MPASGVRLQGVMPQSFRKHERGSRTAENIVGPCHTTICELKFSLCPCAAQVAISGLSVCSAPQPSEDGRPAYWLQRAPSAGSPFAPSPLRGGGAAFAAGGPGSAQRRTYGLRSTSAAFGEPSAALPQQGEPFGAAAAAAAGAPLSGGKRARAAMGAGGAEEEEEALDGAEGEGLGGGQQQQQQGRRVAARRALGLPPTEPPPPAEGEEEGDNELQLSYDEARDSNSAPPLGHTHTSRC